MLIRLPLGWGESGHPHLFGKIPDLKLWFYSLEKGWQCRYQCPVGVCRPSVMVYFEYNVLLWLFLRHSNVDTSPRYV